MITIKINRNKKYNIASSWNDVDAHKLLKLKDNKPITYLDVLSDIPIEVIQNMNTKHILSLYQLCQFVDVPPHETNIEKEINVGENSWKQFENARDAIKTSSIPYMTAQLSGIYFGEEIYKWDMGKLYGQSLQIYQSIALFLERYKELNDSDYNDDQLEAGVKGLETFGVGAVRYSLAKGDATKYKQIEELSAEQVYFTLLYEKALSEYQERLKKIYDRQNGISTSKNG